MAVGAKHKVTVGEVEKLHNEEVRKVITEMVSAASMVRLLADDDDDDI